MSGHLVFFAPSGRRGRVPEGTSVLAAARSLGVDLDSVCGGRGICGRCQIEVSDGSFAKLEIESSPTHLSPPGEAEARYAERRSLPPARRLGCQARLCGDAVIDVPATSQVHRQTIRKAADARPVAVDPVVRLHYVEVAEPDMHEPASDATRLLAALEAQWGLTGLHLPLPVLQGLQPTLRRGAWQVTAAVRHGREIVAVHPGLQERLAGIAIDLGSTTIAAHLCDLATGEVIAAAGAMNPQIRFGEDLMSRVSYGMMHHGGAAELTAAVRVGLDALVGDLAAQAGFARGEIAELTLVGNPVMHHLVLGIDPVELGGAPFALAVDGPVDVPARELGIGVAPGAFVHLLPCIAGHVGADAAAMVLAEAPQESEALVLLVDVGTNAEIVLGNRERLLACSSPTGPAFEGAQITAGQRAAPGAIEAVRIDPVTLEPRYRLIGSPLWSDEPGFAGVPTGLCGSGIIDVLAEMLLAGIIRPDGAIDGALAARSWRIREEYRSFTYILLEGEPRIAVTQHDVRAIQLAKAALHAGAKLLMARMGVAAIPRIKLAGAFGAHIDPLRAMVLGLVPDCPLEGVTSVGNAAGHGARIALVNAAARIEIAGLVRRIEKVETALDPLFQAEFVAAMGLPHATDAYPETSRHVTLPERTPRRRATRGARSGPSAL